LILNEFIFVYMGRCESLSAGEPVFLHLFLITIETQPASTGVVALEPFDSRS